MFNRGSPGPGWAGVVTVLVDTGSEVTSSHRIGKRLSHALSHGHLADTMRMVIEKFENNILHASTLQCFLQAHLKRYAWMSFVAGNTVIGGVSKTSNKRVVFQRLIASYSAVNGSSESQRLWMKLFTQLVCRCLRMKPEFC